MTTIFMYVAALVLGFVLALFIISLKEKPDGYIVINETDPDKDVYTLELGIPFGELNEKKKVIFYTRKVS